MRKFSPVFMVAAASAGLMASLAPATGAAARTAPVRGRPAFSRLSVGTIARARAASVSHLGLRTGVLSGVVRTAAGAPASGACVSATSLGARRTAKTGADGRYLLGGLRPGQYRISVGGCAGPARPARGSSISASWSSGPATLIVRAGQVAEAAPISTWRLDLGSLAAARPAPAEGAARTATGSISGQVTGHGRALRGVCAAAIPLQAGRPTIVLTNKAGKYRLGRLKPGRYDVVFAAGVSLCPNNGDWLFQFYPDVNSLIPTAKVKPVRVRAGRDTGGIDGHLKLGGQISGTVRAKHGRPLFGICTDVIGNLRDGVEVEYTLRTKVTGQYTARGLFPGGYQAEFMIGCGSTGNYASQWWPDQSSASRAKTIRITGARHVTGINAAMGPGASVSGVIKAVNAAGKPVPNVCVFAADADGNDAGFAFSGFTGRYRITGLAAGRYTVQYDPTCYTDFTIYQFTQRSISLRAGQTVTGFDAYLPVGGGVSGVVTDARGRPLGGVCVQINDDNGELGRTRRDGHYSVDGAEDGSFQVMFFGGCGNTESVAPQFYPNSPTSLFAKSVRFRPDRITPNIDATMRPGGAIAGLVTDPAGRRLSRVCAIAASAAQGLGTIIETGSATAQAGRYLIQNLAPGAYALSFGCAGFGSVFFPSQLTSAAASLVAVNPGATTRVQAEPLSRAGAIAGTVTDQAGRPVEYACVQLVPAAGIQNVFFSTDFTNTDEHGHYRIDGLAPARYLVQFSDCSQQGRFGTQWYRRQSFAGSATAVKVFPGRTDAGINALLQPGGTITGLVTGPAGRPANAVCVYAFSPQAQSVTISQTGKAGRYRLTGLSTGRWSLTFTPCFSPKPDLAAMTRPATVRVIAPRTVTGVNVKLARAGSVSGRVTSLAGGKPVPSVCVLLESVNSNGSFGFATTDGHGRYVAAHLGAGNYRVDIADLNCQDTPDAVPPFAPQWFDGQPTPATAKLVHVSAGGRTSGIDGALTSFGAVTGTVTTSGRAAVAGECVTAVPAGDAIDPLSGQPAQPEVAATSRSGGYTLTALAAGRYKIEFTTGCGATGLRTQWWNNAGSAASAKVITVGFATLPHINATLRR